MRNNFFSFKRILIILILGISIWIAIPEIIGLKETLALLSQIKLWWFLVTIFAEIFVYIGSTILTQTVLKMTKDKLSFYDVLKISIMDSFSVQFLPFGSLGEAAVDFYFYRLKNIRTTHIFLMFISRTLIIWFVFAFIYLVGVASTPANSELSGDKLLIIWLIFATALGFFAYLIYLYAKKWLLLKRVNRLVSMANFFAKIFHFQKIATERIPSFVDKVYEAIWILSQNKRLQLASVFGALLFWFGDIFCLYFVFLGFNFKPHIGIVIFAYAVSKILASVTFIPGGLGIVEASMSLIFIGFGLPSSTALAAVLIFRLISFWLPIPFGFSSFLSLQKNYIKMKISKLGAPITH